MPKIALNKGFVTRVDAADLPLVAHWKWHVQATGKIAYARRNTTIEGRTHAIYMHRLILGVGNQVFVSHKDGNGLNNRRRNLLILPPYENLWTRKPKAVGVAYSKNRWRAFADCRGRRYECGYYDDFKTAKTARDFVIAVLRGTKPRVLFPLEDLPPTVRRAVQEQLVASSRFP